MAVAAAASVALLAAVTFNNLQLRGDLDEVRGDLDLVAAALEQQQAAAPPIDGAGVQMVRFDTSNEFDGVDNMGVMVDGFGGLVLRGVPEPPPGHQWQVWIEHRSGAITTPGPIADVRPVIFVDLGNLEATEATGLKVTLEPVGEHDAPSDHTVLEGEMA